MLNKEKKTKLNGLKSFLTCPLFSKKKADELREVASESKKINHHIETVESSVKQLEKLLKKSIKDLVKEQKSLSRKMKKEGDDLSKTIEDSLDSLHKKVAQQTEHVQIFQKTATNKVNSAIETITNVNGSINGIRDYLADNNKNLQRFQAGYDFQILKNFIKPIARTINEIEMLLMNLTGKEKADLEDIKDDLLELLERNSIEQINPNLETSREGKEKETEVLPDKIKTDNPNKRNLIAKVERVGYRYEFNDGQEKIIQAAQVKLYE